MIETRRKILIADDEAPIRESLQMLLKANFDVTVARDGEEAMQAVDTHAPDVILLDVMMPRMDGIEVLKQLRQRSVTVPVIMLTAVNTVKTAVQAMKLGAVDFLNKPFDVEELTAMILATLDRLDRERDAEPPAPPGVTRKPVQATKGDFGPLVGRSPSMTDVFQRVQQVAERDTTVLITGESGTGKELVARQIHNLSLRKTGPFVAINCAAIPETLIESELFGHEKGAFTHAVERRIGHFELAHGGTLFLDEIGELGLSVQVKMLRFLQEQEFFRVGRSKPVQVDVRVVAATNKNLEELVRDKLFRQDLFYRINVINISLPPLRERFEDTPWLIEHFVEKLSSVYGGRALKFAPDALDHLVAYEWPGNVRELENVIESLMALSPHDMVTLEDLPRKVRERQTRSETSPSRVFASGMGFEEAERIFETELIVKALRRANFVQTRAAELLGISRRILKYKMDKLRINERGEIAAGRVSENGTTLPPQLESELEEESPLEDS